MFSAKKQLSHNMICEIHRKLLENIDERKGYRMAEVRVIRAGFKSTPFPYVKADMELLLKWFRQNEKKLHPITLASIFHHKFEMIHPFMDGNGRTGRILLNYILLNKDYPPLIIRKKNRVEYLECLSRADNSELTKAGIENYASIVKFIANEMSDNYWNIFL